jgi:hypothetical protein
VAASALLLLIVLAASADAASSIEPKPPSFPRPLDQYGDAEMTGVLEIIRHRATTEPFNVIATVIFFLAIIHTFLAKKFMTLSHKWRDEHKEKIRKRGRLPRDGAKEEVSFKAELMHFLGEVEAIFGIWVVPLSSRDGLPRLASGGAVRQRCG